MLKRKHFVSGILLAIALGTSLASARQVTPINGNPMFGSESNCFDFPDGGHPSRLEQSCSGTRTWLVDAPMDIGGTAGNRSGSIYGRGTGSVITACYIDSAPLNGDMSQGAWTWGERGSSAWGVLSFNGSGTWTVWVPANGTLHAFCEIPQTGGISGLKFGQ